MNNLKEIMRLNKVNAIDLATATGISKTNIRRLMNDPQATPYNDTAQKLAAALECTAAQIYGVKPAALGDREIIRKTAKDAAEQLVDVLRAYSNMPVAFEMTIETREKDGTNYICFSVYGNEDAPEVYYAANLITLERTPK